MPFSTRLHPPSTRCRRRLRPAGPSGARGRTLQLDVKDGLLAALQVVVVGLQHGLPIDLRATPRRQAHRVACRARACPSRAFRRSDPAEAGARTMMTRFLTARVLRRTLTPPLSAAASARAASSAAAASLAVIASMFACAQHASRSLTTSWGSRRQRLPRWRAGWMCAARQCTDGISDGVQVACRAGLGRSEGAAPPS